MRIQKSSNLSRLLELQIGNFQEGGTLDCKLQSCPNFQNNIILWLLNSKDLMKLFVLNPVATRASMIVDVRALMKRSPMNPQIMTPITSPGSMIGTPEADFSR